MYKYIFGPVQSRRFGLSLGIDLSPEAKSCNFDCLYCELEPADAVKTIKFPPLVKDIVKEAKSALLQYSDIDFITITANGEPTLYKDLNLLVDELNKIKKDKKLLILSNASNICNQKVFESLKKIDVVKLSLDCATKECFKKIDRPLKSICIENIIEGIKKFRKVFNNELIIEILIVKGVNDKKSEMLALGKVLDKIKPDRIDLGTIDRPPAYSVKGISLEKIKELSQYLGGYNISIVHKSKAEKKVDFSKPEISSTIIRRPQSQMDVEYLFSEKSKANLNELIQEGKIVKKIIAGVLFYLPSSKI